MKLSSTLIQLMLFSTVVATTIIFYFNGSLSLEAKYSKITTGMTRDEVISIMKESGMLISSKHLPMTVDHAGIEKPVLNGEVFMFWGKWFHNYIIIGFSNGKVVDKYHYSISL